jgi:hypothetical protein
MNPCEGKKYCMKQVNPKIPGIYFGVPWKYEEGEALSCFLCGLGLGVAYVNGGPLPTVKHRLLKRMTLFNKEG